VHGGRRSGAAATGAAMRRWPVPQRLQTTGAVEAAATGDGKAEEWRRCGRRGGAAATWGDKAEVAGAVVVADYRRGGSCGNGGRQGGTMAAVESTELVRFWLAQSWSVLAGTELVRFGW